MYVVGLKEGNVEMINVINEWFVTCFGSSSFHVYKGTIELWWLDFGTLITYFVIGASAFMLCNAFWFGFKFLMERFRK